MAVEVTLRLPEEIVEHAKRFGEVTERDAEQVLADALAMMWSAMGMEAELIPDVATLTDDEADKTSARFALTPSPSRARFTLR